MVRYRRLYLVAAFTFLALFLLHANFSVPGRRLDSLRVSTKVLDDQDPVGIDLTRFTYIQYVTNLPYFCNSVMLFNAINRLGCMPVRLMMHPDHFPLEDNSIEAVLLRKSGDEYKVILKPIEIQRRNGNDRKSEHIKSL